MTPKEKAKYLINKFTFAGIYFTDGEKGAEVNAKFCAELCVDEILSMGTLLFGEINYWNEVITEIKK